MPLSFPPRKSSLIKRIYRTSERKKKKIFVVCNIWVCQCGWPKYQGIVVLLVLKENFDLLISITQKMVSLVSMRFWKCPVPPLKGIQRLKVQDSSREPSQRALILLCKKKKKKKVAQK